MSNRTQYAERAFKEAGIARWETADTPNEAAARIARGAVLTDDPTVLTRCDAIDLIVEVTGTVDFGASVVLDAFKYGKPVVLVNAELDSLIGPILKSKADQAGVVLTHTDGDEPGVAMTLFRYVQSVGLRPVAAGNIKGMVDYYRTPDTQREFAARNDQDVRKVTSFADAAKLSMETTVLGMQPASPWPAAEWLARVRVREGACATTPRRSDAAGGIVDYSVGAAPHTGASSLFTRKIRARKRSWRTTSSAMVPSMFSIRRSTCPTFSYLRRSPAPFFIPIPPSPLLRDRRVRSSLSQNEH